MPDSLGTDLAVVPNFVAHDASEVDLVARTRVLRVRPAAGGVTDAEVTDLGVVSGRENLAQALILRLLTPRGSLAALGHAAYGSELYRLIGERKTESLRNLCRAYVLAVVAQEPRVEDTALALEFDPRAERFDTFVFTLSVKGKDTGQPVGLTLEFGV
jgi:phage baseplate assembly protein W